MRGAAVSHCRHVRWCDICGNELVFPLGTVAKFSGKGTESSSYEVTNAARGSLGATGVYPVHRVVEQRDVVFGKEQGVRQRMEGTKGQRGSWGEVPYFEHMLVKVIYFEHKPRTA